MKLFVSESELILIDRDFIVSCSVLLGGRLVRSGMIYWSWYAEGLVAVGVVYISC